MMLPVSEGGQSTRELNVSTKAKGSHPSLTKQEVDPPITRGIIIVIIIIIIYVGG